MDLISLFFCFGFGFAGSPPSVSVLFAIGEASFIPGREARLLCFLSRLGFFGPFLIALGGCFAFFFFFLSDPGGGGELEAPGAFFLAAANGGFGGSGGSSEGGGCPASSCPASSSFSSSDSLFVPPAPKVNACVLPTRLSADKLELVMEILGLLKEVVMPPSDVE